MVVNTYDENVTYKISIKISEDPWGDAIYWIGGIALLIAIFGLPIIFKRYMRYSEKTKKQRQKIVQYPCTLCGNYLEYIEPNRQWYCRSCNKYF